VKGRIDHVGIVVAGLEPAAQFARQVLGLELKVQPPPAPNPIAFYGWEAGANVELIELVDPAARVARLGDAVARIDHIAVEVDDVDEGFILDGFPRTMAQAEALDAMLREIDRSLTVVLQLDVPIDVCVERLSKRAEEEGRVDDTPEAIRTRLGLYRQETEPVVEHYRAQGNLVVIHGDRDVDEVFDEIQQALEQAAVRQ
jgi:catechol 2,3-dioxygenase-like lactoylglutathione lyase family enzyme